MGMVEDHSRCCRRRGRQGLQECDDLPTLRFWQFRPHRHTLAHYSVRQNPEQRSRRRLLDFFGAQTGCPSTSCCGVSVAFGAMLFEELSSRQEGVRIVYERVHSGARRLRNFRELHVVAVMKVVHRGTGGVFALREAEDSATSD